VRPSKSCLANHMTKTSRSTGHIQPAPPITAAASYAQGHAVSDRALGGASAPAIGQMQTGFDRRTSEPLRTASVAARQVRAFAGHYQAQSARSGVGYSTPQPSAGLPPQTLGAPRWKVASPEGRSIVSSPRSAANYRGPSARHSPRPGRPGDHAAEPNAACDPTLGGQVRVSNPPHPPPAPGHRVSAVVAPTNGPC
jgi:hypothetical protein